MIYIEYCNVPMKRVFQNKQLAQEITQILKDNTKIKASHLAQLERTFRQMVCLGIEEKIPMQQCEEIFNVMEQWDQKEPISITEMYPFLLEEHWILPMSQISSMKVDMRKGAQWRFDIEKIEKQTRTSEKGEILCIYPYEYEAGSQFQVIEGKKQLQIKFENKDSLYQLMKEILFNGTVDLEQMNIS